MSVDVIIILLLIAIAVVSLLILFRSGGAKRIYDPHAVDLSSEYDPQHDHFSKEHVEKLKQANNKKQGSIKRNIVPPAAVAALEPKPSKTPPNF